MKQQVLETQQHIHSVPEGRRRSSCHRLPKPGRSRQHKKQPGSASKVILLRASNDRTSAAVAKVLRGMGVGVVCESDAESALQDLDLVTCAFVVIPPLVKRSAHQVCTTLRQTLGSRGTPVLVVLRSAMPPREQGALYWSGAAGVFDWPREKLPFLRIVARLTASIISSEPQWRDRALTRAANQRLRKARLDADLSVFVVHGVAVLEGQVSALWKRDAAQVALEFVDGIHDVVSDGVTVLSDGVSDRELAKSVRQMLQGAAEVDASTLAVKVKDGTVTVSGEVAHRREMSRLLDLVRHLRGVRSIESLVTIAPQRKRRDSQIARDLTCEIQDAIRDAPGVAVAVFGGIAVLQGNVRRNSDRRRLERLALEQEGVGRVVMKVGLNAPSRPY